MKNGFTLIELILVITLLGILAATALPKFVDVKKEAVISTLSGMAAALKSGAALAYSKAITSNQLDGEQVLRLKSGVEIAIDTGYPQARFKTAVRYLVNLDNITNTAGDTIVCTMEWCGRGGQSQVNTDVAISISENGQAAKIWPRGYTWSDRCGVHYILNKDGTKPIIGISSSDC